LTAVTFGTWSAPIAYFRSSDGYVGFGTTSPGNKLTIATGAGTPRTGGAGIQLYNGNSNADSRNWMIETPFSGAGNFNISQYQDASGGGAVARFLILPTNSYSRSADVTIDPSGGVGIGTTSPSSWFPARVLEMYDARPVLKLNSSLPAGLSTILFTNSSVNSATHNGEFHLNYSYNQSSPESSKLTFFSYPGGSTMAIQSDGNIGIGTTSPTQKLTVNGTIYGKEVKVDLNVPGPDYVFEKDYKLPSLQEIKSYVDQHKHLEGVPSAKEMEQNGINVSEMNMILLRKIEELTLHVIELKKENQMQNAKINELSAITKKNENK
jgi:hypothetical protein